MELADYEEMTSAMRQLESERGSGRSAMVVRHQTIELLARYVKAAGLRYGPKTQREVFTSMETAEAWLRAVNGPKG